MSNTVLLTDDLEVGSFITILRGKMESRNISTSDGPATVLKENGMWDSFKGRVLKILVVDRPYIVVEYYVPGFNRMDKTSLDTRDLQLKKCSKKYVNIYEPRFEVTEEKPVPDWEFDQEKK